VPDVARQRRSFSPSPPPPRKQILRYVRAFDVTRSRERAQHRRERPRRADLRYVPLALSRRAPLFHPHGENFPREGFSRNGATAEKRKRERKREKEEKKRIRAAKRNALLNSEACYSRSHFLHPAFLRAVVRVRAYGRLVRDGVQESADRANGRTSERPRRRWRLPRIRVIISVS